MENSGKEGTDFLRGVGTLGTLGGDFRYAQHPLSLTAIWQKWVLPELLSRGLLAIVGPVNSVNLWKTSFWKGSWTALARRLFFWFASIFIGYAAKNREPATASFQNPGFSVVHSQIKKSFPRASRDEPPTISARLATWPFSPRKQG